MVTSGHVTEMAAIAIVETPMLHANFMPLCFIEPELLPIEILHFGNKDFRSFGFRDRDDLDMMTFIYELEPYSLEIYRMCENKLPTSRLSKDHRLGGSPNLLKKP